MIESAGFAKHAIVAVEGEAGHALVLDCLALALGDIELGLQGEQVLAPPVGQGLGVFERHFGQLGVGDGVGKGERLVSGQAHEPVEGDLVLGEGVLVAHQLLLVGLQLDLRAEHVEVDADAGVVGERGLAQLLLVGVDQRLGVGDLGLVGQGREILRADGEHHSAAGVEQVQGDDVLCFLGGGVEEEVGEVEEHLVGAELRAGGIHLDDGVDGAGREPKLRD
jgi:hypothetical protein